MAKRLNKKNRFLEKHKNELAKKRGFKDWNDLRAKKDLKDCFMYLHEAALNAIDDLENKLTQYYESKSNANKKTRTAPTGSTLQEQLRRNFPLDR